ncbi:MAG: EAL domain-containing protein [Clostridiaceae bacterium]|nr:EAL domain-containing protein [Clostridiaceae bacterium]
MLLRRKVQIAIISLVSFPLIILSILVYNYTSSKIIEVSKNRIIHISENNNENLTNIINSQKKDIGLIARIHEIEDVLEAEGINTSSELKAKLIDEANLILSKTLTESTELESIFVANLNGRIILSGNKELLNRSVSDTHYFKAGLKSKTVTSNIVLSKLSGEKVVVMSTSILDKDGRVVGVLCNTIKLEFFKNKIANVQLGNKGYAYIVDNEGIIVAHPDINRVGKPIENSTVNKLVGKLKKGEKVPNGNGAYIYQGEEKYMVYGIIPDINWIIVFAQNKSEMNEPATFVLILILVTTFVFIIISIITSIKFSKSITKPISKLIEAMDKAANGNLNSKCEFESKNEFGQLSKNFNVMLNKLNLSHEELAAVHEELSATEEELRAQYEDLQINEEFLRNSEEKYKLAVEGSNDIIWEINVKTKEIYVSEKWNEIVDNSVIEKRSFRSFMKLVHKADLQRVLKTARDHIENKTEFYKCEFRIQLRDGSYKWMLIRGKALRNAQDEVIKIAGSMSDISERKEIEEKIKYMAYYDALTKLPNRAIFIEKLETELNNKSSAGAVMFIDLDNFKNINDTLGHDYGDRLLEVISEKFTENIEDNSTVCRFGGDEFIILKPAVYNQNEIIKFAEIILNIFNEPFSIYEKIVYTTASIGIALYHQDGDTSTTILKNADTAMYTAKASGKNMYAFFDEKMHYGLERRIKIEAILRRALNKNSFELYYQPQVDIKNNKITGFEALLRLNYENMGFISPTEFIPIAEECGLIKEIGEWCLKNACLKNKEWRDKGYEFGCISVNISCIQFQQGNFTEVITKILREADLRPEFLEIEITETVLMRSLEKNVKILEGLRNMGIKIALDDFGTGYSSFNYLRRLPINTLKIDKSFIDGICLNSKEEAIAFGIIQLAHKMELEVVAEGVEYEQQLNLLKAQNCDKVQGYLFSKPVPADVAEKLLKEGSFNLK